MLFDVVNVFLALISGNENELKNAKSWSNIPMLPRNLNGQLRANFTQEMKFIQISLL